METRALFLPVELAASCTCRITTPTYCSIHCRHRNAYGDLIKQWHRVSQPLFQKGVAVVDELAEAVRERRTARCLLLKLPAG